MKNHQATYTTVILIVTLVAVAEQGYAQQTGDDFKRQLKKSLNNSSSNLNLKPEFKYQNPQQVEQYNSDVLKVSPTNKLPTKYDRVVSNSPYTPEEKNRIEKDIDKTEKDIAEKAKQAATDEKNSPVTRVTDYSNGKLHSVPDARSITQQCQYTGQGAAVIGGDLDIDPVRAIQRHKAKKRKEKVDRIKHAYGQN